KKSPFGNKNDTRAELAVMLSLDRYVLSGRLESPVVDLWKGDSDQFIVPLREIQRMTLSIKSDVPDGTAVEYYFRKGTNPQPFSDEWEQYEVIGHGPRLEYEIGGADLNRRYVQFKAVLSTENPLKSPVIHSAVINAELIERIPPHNNIHVVKCDNPPIRYSSVPWEWETWNRPELAELRNRLNIDDIISGSRTQFEAQVRVLDAVSKRWMHSSPWPGFPAPDALNILDRVESSGGGGYCSQFAHVLVGVCLSCGWPARIVNIVGHAVTEVWNDDYGKWIFFDADYVNHYNYDAETAEPLGLLELHKHYLDYYFPQKTIEWMPGGINWAELIEGQEAPVKSGSLTHPDGARLTGFINAAFIRMVPRNNWFEKPVPIPLIHGSSSDNPLNGYIHWYDEQTPPKRNYSWYTDRPRDMWFDMNTVHIDAVSGFGNDRLFLRFETYTPGFSHFEVNVDDTGWHRSGERRTWLLQSGRNTLRVRAVNTYGTCGKPSYVVVNHADAPFGE
ncbi:transglutaminase-like domain-containing protein, partial [Candidatus Omnitrophota bacterium]